MNNGIIKIAKERPTPVRIKAIFTGNLLS